MSHRNIESIEEVEALLYELHVGVVGRESGRHERPHKPLLLLAVLDLIAKGQATPDYIPWSRELRERFAQYFELVRRHDDNCAPENPFFYLRNDGFWEPCEILQDSVQPLGRIPLAGDATRGTVFAKLIRGMDRFVTTPQARLRLREALVARYFPQVRSALTRLFLEGAVIASEAPRSNLGEPEVAYGRSAGFRRKILEVYDHQCAACGLRIKLPDLDLTFVDAAHLIPFADSGNDHPTNGLALCKNHHWAMDRYLIAPTPDRLWKVSRVLDPRRSRGEEELLRLDGEPVLPPVDCAFGPSLEGLRWRLERLAA